MEDVGSDDLVGAKREHDEQGETEEDTASDRGEAHEEAAEDPDQHRRDAVAARQDEGRVAQGFRAHEVLRE